MKFKDEEHIKNLARSDKNIADFWLQEFDCNIFIDVKGVEMTKSGKVAYRSGDIRKVTKSHVRKAIYQCNSAARIIAREVSSSARPNTFAIVVTYKEMYLGSGERFFEMTGEEEYRNLQIEFGESTISPENIFFLSISDFERLICSQVKRRRRIGEFLKTVRQDDRRHNPKKNKFNFSMHLDSARSRSFPKFLEDEYERMTARIETSLRQGTPIGG